MHMTDHLLTEEFSQKQKITLSKKATLHARMYVYEIYSLCQQDQGKQKICLYHIAEFYQEVLIDMGGKMRKIILLVQGR